jgi:hypothetical protein
VVGVDDHAGLWVAVGDGHPQSIGDQGRGLTRIDRPSDHPPGKRVQHDRAVHLAFIGAVFGDIGDPQPVWLRAGEHALNEIGRGGSLVAGPRTTGAGQALDGSAGHQHLDLIVADLQAQSEGQFGMDPPSTVGAPRCGMYGADLLGEPDVADRALRGRPRPPFVVPRLGHHQQPAGQLHG